MQLVTVGSKYQIVIPKEARKKLKGITPGSKMAVSVGKNELTIKPKSENWIDRYQGIAKKAWRRIDTTKYLEGLRNEWDRKI